MSHVVVINSVTLDEVVQGPGRAEEDTRGGFSLGGWAVRSMNDEIQAAVNSRVAEAGGLRDRRLPAAALTPSPVLPAAIRPPRSP